MGFRSRSRVLRGLPLESGQDSSADSAAVYVGRLLTRSTLHDQPACDVACVFSCNRLAMQRPRESCRRCSWSISSGTITETITVIHIGKGDHKDQGTSWSPRCGREATYVCAGNSNTNSPPGRMVAGALCVFGGLAARPMVDMRWHLENGQQDLRLQGPIPEQRLTHTGPRCLP
jgi:hypothetical protein